jgi:hypothetical protein
MGVPPQCTIVGAMGRSAYSSKLNTQLYSVSVKKALSKSPYIVYKLNISL